MMDTNELVALVTRAQAGDNEAMSILYNEYYNSVYYFALKTVRDENIAADITHETFVQVITYINTLRNPALFGSWLRSISYSRCTRYFSQSRERLTDEDDEGIFEDIREDKAEFIPDEALDQLEFRRTVMAIIDDLSDEQRAAVLMYYFDELSVKQIAAIQGVSEGTVKSRLNYARKYIKSSVEEYEKKHGISLHGALIPLLYWIFSSEVSLIPAEVAATAVPGIAAATGVGLKVGAGSQIATATGAGVQGSAGNTVVKNAAQDAVKMSAKKSSEKAAAEIAKATAKTAAKTAAKSAAGKVGAGVVAKAGMTLGAKIAAGVVAAAVTAGAATGGVLYVKNRQENKTVPETEQTEKIDDADIGNGGKTEEENLFKNVEVGGIVTFGSYEQDNDISNGAEAIEWVVLAKEEDRSLIISRYVLDARRYNEESVDMARWETSDIRAWLNEDFCNSVFTEVEKGRIINSHFNDEGTNSYANEIFLLSVDESEEYFSSDEERICEATEYSKSKGLTIENGTCWWLLRSSGTDISRNPAYVHPLGAIQKDGDFMYGSAGGIRPAMWVSLDAESEPVVEDVQNDAGHQRDEEDGDHDWNGNNSADSEDENRPSDRGTYVSELTDSTLKGRWETYLTFDEFFEAAGSSGSSAYDAMFEYGSFTKEIVLYWDFDSDKSAVGGVDTDSLMAAMPEFVDAMVEYMCSPEVLAENEGFEPEDYDRWFASIGTTPEQYKENLKRQYNAMLEDPRAAEALAEEAVDGQNCTYEIDGDTLVLYQGSRKYDELYLEDGKLWVEADNGIKVSFTKK